MKKYKTICIALSLFLLSVGTIAQGTRDDYARADSIRSMFSNKIYYDRLSPSWIGETNKFVYPNNTPDGIKYVLIDPSGKKRSIAFSNEKLARAMMELTDKKIDSKKLPLSRVNFNEDLRSFTFVWDNVNWTCKLNSYKLESGEKISTNNRGGYEWTGLNHDETSMPPVESPDGKYKAYIRDFNLFIKDKDENETRLSYDGGTGKFYSSNIKWSPDSKKIMAYIVRPSEEHIIHYIESSPDDQVQPKHIAKEYTKPGDALPQYYPNIFNIESGQHFCVGEEIITNQFGLENLSFSKDSKWFSFEYNKRGHQVYQVIFMDTETGDVRIAIDERSYTFFHYSGKKFRHDLDNGNEIIWSSERDGWNHLYLYDGQTGKVRNQITKGEWVVRDVEFVDEDLRQIVFMASGKEDGDPYFINYYSINFDGSGLRKLTDGYGNHEADFSPDKKYFVDTWSTVANPSVSVLRRTLTGIKEMDLEQADISDLLSSGWIAPEVFSSKGRDGITDIWGVIFKPTNFDSSKKYPVIEYIYAGPHNSFVPKSFRPYYAHIQPLAELGFVIVQIDGMGTSNRSKAFHDVCYKNLKDAGFPDRILWIKDAASKFEYMDITNVGIYGTSAGGQSSTGALLFHPDFYKVAVSSCGCHDNRMDKIWWNEQWMGWPVGIEYSESSNVDNAYKLKGKLLLINGEMDFNVDPTSTIQVVNALIKANKNFDYLFVPGMGHSSGGDYGEHKRRDFFVKNILGVEPPEWY